MMADPFLIGGNVTLTRRDTGMYGLEIASDVRPVLSRRATEA
jgi:hypothetical protein